MCNIAVGVVLDKVFLIIDVFMIDDQKLLVEFFIFQAVAGIVSCVNLLFENESGFVDFRKSFLILVENVLCGTACRFNMDKVIDVASHRNILIFREHQKEITCSFEFQDIECMWVVAVDLENSFVVDEDRGVENNRRVAVDGLDEDSLLVVRIVKVYRHLELFCFVAAA